MDLPPDFRELLEELALDAVEFLLIGGYAVAFHGRPRATKDIDIFLEGSPADLGQPPLRVDFLRSIEGVESAGLFARAVDAEVDGLAIKVISLDDLIVNKRAAARPQDILDADFLERVRSASSKEPPL